MSTHTNAGKPSHSATKSARELASLSGFGYQACLNALRTIWALEDDAFLFDDLVDLVTGDRDDALVAAADIAEATGLFDAAELVHALRILWAVTDSGMSLVDLWVRLADPGRGPLPPKFQITISDHQRQHLAALTDAGQNISHVHYRQAGLLTPTLFVHYRPDDDGVRFVLELGSQPSPDRGERDVTNVIAPAEEFKRALARTTNAGPDGWGSVTIRAREVPEQHSREPFPNDNTVSRITAKLAEATTTHAGTGTLNWVTVDFADLGFDPDDAHTEADCLDRVACYDAGMAFHGAGCADPNRTEITLPARLLDLWRRVGGGTGWRDGEEHWAADDVTPYDNWVGLWLRDRPDYLAVLWMVIPNEVAAGEPGRSQRYETAIDVPNFVAAYPVPTLDPDDDPENPWWPMSPRMGAMLWATLQLLRAEFADDDPPEARLGMLPDSIGPVATPEFVTRFAQCFDDVAERLAADDVTPERLARCTGDR